MTKTHNTHQQAVTTTQMASIGLDIDPDLLDMLSPEALAALKEVKSTKSNAITAGSNNDFVSEDFGKSQFWYDDETSDLLADEAVEMANQAASLAEGKPAIGSIACVSSPSVFRALVAKKVPNRIVLFEFDNRFATLYGDMFSFYDVHHPRTIDRPFVHSFDVVIADPPYLNVDCMSKTGETIKLLHRGEHGKTIYNTGAILEEAIFRVLGLRKLVWQPRHSSHLSNTFYSFANYASERFGGFDKPIEAVVESVKQLNIVTPESAQVPA